MRIVVLHPGMCVKGGSENFAMWLVQGLRDRGHTAMLVTDCYDSDLWSRELRDQVEVRILPRAPWSTIVNSNAVRLWERARQLARAVGDADVVVAQRFPFYRWATEARRRFGGDHKVVWLCQEPLRRLYPRVTDRHLTQWRAFVEAGVENDHLDRAAAARLQRSRWQRRKDARCRRWDADGVAHCDLIVANSTFTAGNVEEIFGVNPQVCHLGIPLPPVQDYIHGSYVGVLSALAERKNLPNIIRAMGILHAQGRSDIPMKIAGRGPDRAVLETLAGNLTSSGQIEFLGGIGDEQLPQFFANARMLVYCPIDEPFGLVPLEASAMKTPPIVSNHGGPAETVSDGVTGVHVNPFDPDSIASAIKHVWDDPERCREMAESASERTREHFAFNAFLDRFIGLLTKTASA